MIAEFVPSDHVRLARDKLRRLRQTSAVSKYLAEFRNLALTNPDMTDGEKLDKFCVGLKYEVRVEVLKLLSQPLKMQQMSLCALIVQFGEHLSPVDIKAAPLLAWMEDPSTKLCQWR